MSWIRGPLWDGLWIWSGVPIGVMLLGMGLNWHWWTPQALVAFFFLAVALENGHNVSPIVLGWTHSGFRRHMLANPWKFIGVPVAVLAAAAAVGLVTSLGWTTYAPGPYHAMKITNWTNPYPLLVWVYLVWQAYHFGMQNFGIAMLYCRRLPASRARRLALKYTFLPVTMFGMLGLPMFVHSWQLGLMFLGVFSVSHWLQAIGLSSAVSRRGWIFTAALLAIGAIGFVWLRPTPMGNAVKQLGVFLPLVLCMREGFGIWHFLMDRWLWRFSDPLVRDTIGRDLFSPPAVGRRGSLASESCVAPMESPRHVAPSLSPSPS